MDPSALDVATLDAEAERLTRYLAGRPSSFWRDPHRASVLRHLAQALADLAAQVEGRPSRPVPAVPHTALADLVLVTAHDLRLAASGGVDVGDQVLPGLAEIIVHRADLDGRGVPRAWAPVVAEAALPCRG